MWSKKYFEKNQRFFFEIFSKIEKSKNGLKFLDFFRNFENLIFFPKPQKMKILLKDLPKDFFFEIENFEIFKTSHNFFFSKYFFDHKKIFFFDEFFFKFISCVRRIVLKQFQYDSGSLKVRKVKDKRYYSYI